MKVKVLILVFLTVGLVCNAQKELFMINKSNEVNKVRVSKGNFLRIKLVSGKKVSGTLVKVTDNAIVLMAYSATIDIEEIVYLKIVHKKSQMSVVPASGPIFVYGFPVVDYFNTKDWKMVIREG
jgi:hypothetical protein